MKLAELFVEIAVNTAGLGTALGGAEAGLRTFGSTAAALGAAAGAAFMEAMKGALQEAMNLQSEFVKVDKAVDLGPAMGQFKEDLFAMSTELKGVSLQSLIDIAVGAGKGGIPTDNLLTFTEGIAKLSVALDDIPAGEIVDSLIQVNAAFKLPQETLINLGSAIDKVADSGALAAGDLFRAMQRLAGPANALGLSVDQLAGLSGALLNSGLNADAAADGLRELFMRLGDPESVKGLAEVLGVEFEQLKQQIKTGPMVVIEQLLSKLSGKDLFGANEIFEKLGVGSQVAAGHILTLSRSMDEVGKFSAMAAEQLRTGEQAADSYAKASATAAAEQQTMQNEIDIAQAKIGEAFLPALSELFKLLGDIAAAFADNSGAAKSWGTTLVEVLGGMRVAMNDYKDSMIYIGSDLFIGFFQAIEAVIGKDWMGKIFGFTSEDMNNSANEALDRIGEEWKKKQAGEEKPSEELGVPKITAFDKLAEIIPPEVDPELEQFQQEFEWEIGFGPRPDWMGPEGNVNFDFPTLPVEEQIAGWEKDNAEADRNKRRGAMGVEEFANSILESALNDDQGKRQADLTERVAKGVEEMNRNLGRFVDGTEIV